MTTQSEQHEALVEEIGKRICHWQQGGLLCTYPNCDCGNWKWRAASEILALIVHDAPWRTALCSVQRTGPATKINCGDEGAYWEARG